MKAYRVHDAFTGSPVQIVIAESIAEAEKVYQKYYNNDIKSIELVSEYVLIQEED